MSTLFSKENIKKIMWWLGGLTILVTAIEGIFFYSDQASPMLKALLIVQNSFQTFLMDSTIELTDAIEATPADAGLLQKLILYCYAVSQIAAPMVTATALYHTIELFLRRFKYRKKHRSGEPIIVFGYNEFSRNLILSADENYVPYLNPGRKLEQEEELEMLRNRVPMFQDPDEIKNVLGDVKNVILADTDIAADLAMLLDIKAKSRELSFNKDCRYHIFYDDPGDRWLSEKVCRTAVDSEDIDIEKTTDIEFFDLSEIAARKAVKALPFHTWQDQTGWKDKNFHMLLVGFGSMGKQILLKAMNQAVFASGSNMIFDVVDLQARRNSGLFFNQFRAGYVKRVEGEAWDEYIISSPESDGKLVIRLHEVDCRLVKFKRLLGSLIEPRRGEAYGPFTYGMICLSDNAASIQALMGIQDMIRDFNAQDEFPVCIRVSGGERESLFEHVKAAIPSCTCVAYDRNRITLEDILQDDRESAARMYNWMYNNVRFVSGEEASSAPEGASEKISEEKLLKEWLEMEVFQKDSSRALYEHKTVKEALIRSQGLEPLLLEATGENGSLLKRKGSRFALGSDEEFLEKLDRMPEIEELMKTEHRRWNYFMASQGWTSREGVAKKDPDRKLHPCMTDWEHLKQNKPDTCKYDLVTYLLAEYFAEN